MNSANECHSGEWLPIIYKCFLENAWERENIAIIQGHGGDGLGEATDM